MIQYEQIKNWNFRINYLVVNCEINPLAWQSFQFKGVGSNVPHYYSNTGRGYRNLLWVGKRKQKPLDCCGNFAHPTWSFVIYLYVYLFSESYFSSHNVKFVYTASSSIRRRWVIEQKR